MKQVEQPDSDRDLVAGIAAGDERALALLYDRFGSLAYSLAYQILGNAADAEEVVADAFVQVWSSAATFDPARASVGAWLSMITRTRALDRLRSVQRRTRLIDRAANESAEPERTAVPLSSVGPEPDRQAEQADLRTRVTLCLAELPAAQRRVLELAYFAGLSHSEIAAAINEPLGTVKTRVRAAMTKLRQALAAYEFVE
ncbi:MAG TPA: sigma-70 family RNA polymerase sigma factor [Longimicrobiales bacterium]|nr:sigma-70 family RNA polymerase sigma factor [Longimicrobiales bacterium]